jgi:surface antigen/peptidoglycan hydrolase CwlO-like protein
MFIWKVHNKNMKQKITTILTFIRRKTVISAMLGLSVFMAGASLMQQAQADIGSQIQELQAQNARNEDIVAQLEDQATSYQDAINQLQARINIVQTQINLNTAKQQKLEKRIKANEVELAKQRKVLGENIRVMYVEGQISTIEMLATSKNLSDFVDKEEYRTAVKNKIQETLQRIADLQNVLNEQKVQVERLLADQQKKQSQLASARAKQASMLTYNQSQQSAYNAKTEKNNARIQELIAQQRAANNTTDGGYYFLRFDGPVRDFNPSNYPYRNAGFSMQPGPCSDYDSYPDTVDRWGYCTRQCVSYAAWAVEASGREAPMYYGNAKEWVSAAYDDGVTVSRIPRAGDIAISTSGYWGHAMYVEKVEASRIYVSQYNAGLDGRFSYQWRNY